MPCRVKTQNDISNDILAGEPYLSTRTEPPFCGEWGGGLSMLDRLLKKKKKKETLSCHEVWRGPPAVFILGREIQDRNGARKDKDTQWESKSISLEGGVSHSGEHSMNDNGV